MENWLKLIESLGGIAIVTGALAWLVRSILSHWLSKDVELYKTRLSLETAKHIEDFKAGLQIILREHDIRFTKLHEKRADVIANLYYLIDHAETTVTLFQRVMQLRDDEKADEKTVERWAAKAVKATNSLFYFVQRNQLFFSHDLTKKIQEVMFDVQEPVINYKVLKMRNRKVEEGVPIIYREIAENWIQKFDQISSAKKMIENEFRKMLGSDAP